MLLAERFLISDAIVVPPYGRMAIIVEMELLYSVIDLICLGRILSRPDHHT